MTPSWIAQLLQFDRQGDTFVAPQPDRPGDRLFGGLIAAQALAAAGATVDPGKHPQSLHSYFVRGGDYGVDVEYVVERIRDGRSFDTRQVTANQRGATILEMIASFHRPEPGPDWHPVIEPGVQFDATVPKTPDLPYMEHFDFRVEPGDDSVFVVAPLWARTHAAVEDDPLMRACTLTFLSDIGLMPVARPPGAGLDDPGPAAASLDHSAWFHRPYRPDTWHRYEARSLNHSDSRGLVLGSLFDASGALIATTSQEALWRV